ncbi:MAG TPA: VOC family protein [Methanocella sp.]|nr:VOC family protein [Methanocella sp.]
MIERLTHVTILVKDYDEALDFYTKKLGFKIVEDAKMPSGDRWLTVAPPGDDVQVVLQRPGPATFGDNAREMLKRVGQGTNWVFKVDDCGKTCDELAKKGVRIQSPPQDLGFAVEAVFEDLYGNAFTLMEPGRK